MKVTHKGRLSPLGIPVLKELQILFTYKQTTDQKALGSWETISALQNREMKKIKQE